MGGGTADERPTAQWLTVTPSPDPPPPLSSSTPRADPRTPKPNPKSTSSPRISSSAAAPDSRLLAVNPEGFGGRMGGGEEDKRVVPRLDPIPDLGRNEMASLPIPGELLAEILLRLPTPADLVPPLPVTPSAAPPPIAPSSAGKVFYPAIVPHHSASAASAVALAADFSFSFLPAPASDWVIRDIRDGRVLLDKPMLARNRTVVFPPEVVVCDPLHRRYLLLPPIASDLDALVEDLFMTNKQLCFEIFLAPPGCGVEAATTDETSFSVIRMAQSKTRPVAFAFSSNTGQWTAVPSRRWSDLSADWPPLTAPSLLNTRHYVYGCFYWLAAYSKEFKLLVLDTKTMEISIAEPPPIGNSFIDFAMVEAGEGRLGMFVVRFGRSDLNYFIRQNDGGSSSQWQKVKTISLCSWPHLICNMDRYLLLHLGQKNSLLEQGCYMLDIETFQLEKVCALETTYYALHAYSNFPPSLLSSPTISSGVEKVPEKEMLDLEQGCAASSSTESAR